MKASRKIDSIRHSDVWNLFFDTSLIRRYDYTQKAYIVLKQRMQVSPIYSATI